MRRLATILSIFFFTLIGTPSAFALSTDSVTVWSESGELSPNDEDFLREQTAKLNLPDEIKQVDYLVFTTGSKNLNVDMVEFARSQRPELIAADDKKWAPGHLLVAVSMQARQNGIYMGDDVAAATDFNEKRKAYALEQMKPDLKNGNVALGLLAGTKGATVAELPKENIWPALIGGIIGAIAGIGGVIGALVVVWRSRKKQAQIARDDFDFVSKNYGRIAQDLDAIDVRAHSLTSPLANDALREQWEDIRSRFLSLHDVQSKIPDLTGASDRTMRRHAKKITSMRTTVDEMLIAEKNIDDLYKMEHEGTDIRRRELHSLRNDMLAAKLKTKLHDDEVVSLIARADQLLSTIDSPEFMDDYALLISDYRIVTEAITEEKKLSVPGQRAPKLYEKNWQVGTGYYNWVPFIVVNQQHQTYQAEQATASSSSVNSSYGSTGFSGAGGSSSW